MFGKFAAGLALGMALVSPALAEGQAFDKPADWLEKPRADDFRNAWPAKATAKSGQSIVTCRIETTGSLSECRVVMEDPQGQGFGEAAMSLTSKIRMKPAMKGGVPVASEIRIPIAFEAPTAGAPYDTPPDWLKKPTAADMMAVWPNISMNRSGSAVVACKVNTRGVLFGCSVVSEKPEGSGFGLAALALTPQFLMKPAMKGGAPVVSEVRIPIDFSGDNSKARFADPPMTQRIIAKPVWREAPSRQAVAAVYPPKAAAQRLSGHVTLVCVLDKTATPKTCETVREQPTGAGFARAARSLTEQFKGPATLADGKSTRGISVQMMFSFAPEILDGTVTASRPLWLDTPTAQDLLIVFPQPANKAGVRSARVVMACTVAPGGRLEPCSVESEEPKGYEIGKAMLPAASKFRLSPWSEDGTPLVGTTVRVPIRYAIEDAPAPVAKP